MRLNEFLRAENSLLALLYLLLGSIQKSGEATGSLLLSALNYCAMSVYKLVIAILSLVSIIMLSASLFIDKDGEVYRLINYYDYGLCTVFLYDFFKQLKTADNKWRYFYTWGWLDLISSIPVVSYFRAARFFRIFRVVRIFKSMKILILFLRSNRKSSLYGVLVLFIAFTVIISSVFVLYLEQDVGNIRTAEDALWWTFISITTVGYGDYYPVTGEGKIAATSLIFAGLITFGTVISFLNETLESFKDDPE